LELRADRSQQITTERAQVRIHGRTELGFTPEGRYEFRR